MGRTANSDLAKALKMAERGMDEFAAWKACGEPTCDDVRRRAASL